MQQVPPVKYKTSQKLIGHDVNNASYNYKTTFHVELPTICKDDVVCLLKKSVVQKLNDWLFGAVSGRGEEHRDEDWPTGTVACT